MNPKTSTPSLSGEGAEWLAHRQRNERLAVMALLVAARRHRLKQSWSNMLTRCYNPKAEHYRRYGGRGITVCNQWRYNFTAFAQWALRHGFYTDLTIDRRENDKGYYPGNCRWLPWLENYRGREITDHYRNNSRALLAKVNRAAVLAKASAVNSKPVIASNGAAYPSGQVASLSLGLDRNAVGQAIRKGQRTAGLYWRYA